MQASMEIVNGLDGFSVDESMILGSTVTESDNLDNDSQSFYKSLPGEVDSIWEDLKAHLIVLRMVNDSVIKGMVNAIEAEAAEKIAAKEAEVAALNRKLQFYESIAAKVDSLDFLTMVEPRVPKTEFLQPSLNARQELAFVKHLDRLRIAAEEQLQRLPQEPTKVSVSEKQWEEKLQREIGSVVVQNLIRNLQEEFETKVCEQRSLMNSINNNWQKGVNELSTIRQELHAMYRSLSSSDPILLCSHNNLEGAEEWNGCKRKDHFSWKPVGSFSTPTSHTEENGNGSTVMEKSGESVKHAHSDLPHLKHMTREEVIAYYKAEMTKMKRQHDSALQEKTEELFILKREFLKEKGSSPLHFKKEKDFEQMRKKISEFISKLDAILLENEKLPFIHDDQDGLCSLKERIDALFKESQVIQRLLSDRNMGTGSVPSEVPLVEINFINQIQMLQSDMEDLKMEAIIKDEIYKSVLKDVVGESQNEMETTKRITMIVEDHFSMIYREVTRDALSSLDPILLKLYEEKDSIRAVVLEKEKALCLHIQENERLKQEMTSLLALLKEKETVASEAVSELVQQKEQFNSVCDELDIFKDLVSKQESIISNNKKESDMVKDKLDESLQQIHQHEVEISNLKQKFMIVSDALEEVKRQRSVLYSDIQEKQEKLTSAIRKEEEQKRQLQSVIVSLMELSKATGICDRKLTEDMKSMESRLKTMSQQCSQLKQHALLLKRKGLWYKRSFEGKCVDIQKAEAEVDLLGDEVDVLSSLLEKLYIALDHYSPVLLHYPGVVEVLKLIRKELKGETAKLA